MDDLEGLLTLPGYLRTRVEETGACREQSASAVVCTFSVVGTRTPRNIRNEGVSETEKAGAAAMLQVNRLRFGTARGQVTTLAKQLQRSAESIDGFESMVRRYEEEVKALREELRLCACSLEYSESQLANQQQDIATLQAELRQRTEMLANAEAALGKLEAEMRTVTAHWRQVRSTPKKAPPASVIEGGRDARGEGRLRAGGLSEGDYHLFEQTLPLMEFLALFRRSFPTTSSRRAFRLEALIVAAASRPFTPSRSARWTDFPRTRTRARADVVCLTLCRLQVTQELVADGAEGGVEAGAAKGGVEGGETPRLRGQRTATGQDTALSCPRGGVDSGMSR
eukprot:1194423-Prorocentrum_minimum.AAC.19